MGQIPVFQTSPGAVPDTAGMPRANFAIPQPRDAGAAVAGAAEDIAGSQRQIAGSLRQGAAAYKEVGDAAGQFAEQYANAKMEVDAADQSAALSQKLTQVQFEASKIPDRDQAAAAYDTGAQKVYDDWSASGMHPLVRAKVAASFAHENVLRRAETQNAAFQLWGQDQRGKLFDHVVLALTAAHLEPFTISGVISEW